jgi:hypothetical protein
MLVERLALGVVGLHVLLKGGSLAKRVHLLLRTHELVLGRVLRGAPLVKGLLLVKILVVWLHGFW